MKKFDGSLKALNGARARAHPFLAVEVAFRGGFIRILLEEGLSILSEFTDVALVLQVDSIEKKLRGLPKKVYEIRIILLE